MKPLMVVFIKKWMCDHILSVKYEIKEKIDKWRWSTFILSILFQKFIRIEEDKYVDFQKKQNKQKKKREEWSF